MDTQDKKRTNQDVAIDQIHNPDKSIQTVEVVETVPTVKDGQSKCPKCGSTDIELDPKTGRLRCQFCRYVFEEEKAFEQAEKLEELKGLLVSSGAQTIDQNVDSLITLKCQSCGAQVVIDSNHETQARCHWCRNTLSIKNKLPNGAIPDAVLPFTVSKSSAQDKIKELVNSRKFFAHPRFVKEFTANNIMAVYLPYLLVDVNAHARFQGQGEKLVKTYQAKVSKDQNETRYDADLYQVEREFDLVIDDLTLEASKDKFDTHSSNKTSNIINAIMPFDTENCVTFDANFLKNASSEKRDIDVSQLREIAKEKSRDVAKFAAKDSLDYNRGVAWTSQELLINGESWHAVYLPIWLYSFLEKKNNNKEVLHYVALNGRSGKTMGSIPIYKSKLVFVSILISMIGAFVAFLIGKTGSDTNLIWLLTLFGPIFYFVISGQYRNATARHVYEKDTKCAVHNLTQKDVFMEHRIGLKNSQIPNRNDDQLTGNYAKLKE